MSDIVERAREEHKQPYRVITKGRLLLECADEIERLRNTIKNCPPVSESEYVRRLEDEIMALTGRLGGDQ